MNPSREWLSLWMVVVAGVVAIAAMPDGSFVPGGVIVIGLVVLYAAVFAVRRRRHAGAPKDDTDASS